MMNADPRALRILNMFFVIATFAFSALSLTISINSSGVVWFMWRDQPVLALTLVGLALLMACGWWYTARWRRSLLIPDQMEFPKRGAPRPSGAGNAYNIWKEMNLPNRLVLALAVFLIFGTIGPLSILMGNLFSPVSWQRVLLLTIASGGISASIILFGNKPLWMILAVTICMSGNIYVDRLEEMWTGQSPVVSLESSKGDIVLDAAVRSHIGFQRQLIGAAAILLLAAGYVIFIVLLNVEGAQRLRLETEVAIARGIQDSLLPSGTFRNSWAEVSGHTIPTSEVGGDYFDVFPLSADELVVVIADVAGHGVGAGILSAMTKSALRSQLQHDASPATVLTNLNATLYNVTDKKTFVTIGYLLLNSREKIARLATAGHPPILQARTSTGDLQDLRTANLALGIQAEGTFSELTIPITTGDTFLLYTDGITEAMDARNDQFGSERLREVLSNNRSAGAKDLCRAVLKSVQAFGVTRGFKDDVTVVSVRL